MTDLYPDEEGYIDEGTIVGFCKAAGSITLHGAVKLGATGVSNYISVLSASDGTDGHGFGIALKAADTNDYIPVAFKGIVKQTVGAATFSVGYPVISAGTTVGYVEKKVAIAPCTTAVDLSNLIDSYMFMGAGATTKLYKLGYALQAGTTAGDEVLIMLAGLT